MAVSCVRTAAWNHRSDRERCPTLLLVPEWERYVPIRSWHSVYFFLLHIFLNIWYWYIFAVSQKSICVGWKYGIASSIQDGSIPIVATHFNCLHSVLYSVTVAFEFKMKLHISFYFWMAAAQPNQQWPSRTNIHGFSSLLCSLTMSAHREPHINWIDGFACTFCWCFSSFHSYRRINAILCE